MHSELSRPFNKFCGSILVPLVAAALSAAWPGTAAAQRVEPLAQQVDAPAEAEKVVTRVYDVRDLLVRVNDYPFLGTMVPSRQLDVPAMGGGGVGGSRDLFGGANPAPTTGPTPAPVPNPYEMEDMITRLISETVDPDSWKDAGGSIGVVRMVQGQMIVTQTQENHRQLLSLLSQLRETKAKMVRVRAQWLLLPPAEADKLLGQGSPEGRQREAVQRMEVAALAKLPQGATRFRGETVGLNTQTVHVVSGPTRTVVADVDAQVGTGTAAFDPVIEVARGGLMLQVKPTLSADGRTAWLDLHSAFVSPNPDGAGIRPQATTAGEGGKPGAAPLEMSVDRLDATVQELRTTVVVPIARPVLIGGMTLNAEPGKPDGPQLYLVVEVIASEEGGAQ